MMTPKQRFSVFVMILLGTGMAGLAAWMIVGGRWSLWAAELALLCCFSVALRTYAFEWRRQRDNRERP